MSNQTAIPIEFIRQYFPLLAQKGLAEAICEKATLVKFAPGKVLFLAGDPIKVIPLLLKGAIKVSRTDAEGHDVLLYYIHPGESCAMTLSSCLRREHSRVRAVTEQATELIALPPEAAHDLARKHPAWFDFVLESYSLRFDELLMLVDAVSFTQLDVRLNNYLLEKSALLGTTVLHLSHQDIAADLGTARAVISRLLKQMERKGMVKLLRARIKILALV